MVRIIIKGGARASLSSLNCSDMLFRCLEGDFTCLHHSGSVFVVDSCNIQNTEDEVLKAAIAKYGKNQWYAGLLPRKSRLC